MSDNWWVCQWVWSISVESWQLYIHTQGLLTNLIRNPASLRLTAAQVLNLIVHHHHHHHQICVLWLQCCMSLAPMDRTLYIPNLLFVGGNSREFGTYCYLWATISKGRWQYSACHFHLLAKLIVQAGTGLLVCQKKTVQLQIKLDKIQLDVCQLEGISCFSQLAR